MSEITLAQVDSYLDAAEYFASQGQWQQAQHALQDAWYLLGQLLEQEQKYDQKSIIGPN